MRPQKPREIAFRVLCRHNRTGAFIDSLLDAELDNTKLEDADRHLAQELVYGVVRWRATLDWLISRKARSRQRPAVRVLLHLGLYQLFWLTRVPDHAAVNETVQLAREFGLATHAGFLNAVLRAYAREKDETLKALDTLKTVDPALGWSHPAWLVDRWINHFGRENTTALLAWNNTPAPTFARVNTILTNPKTLVDSWKNEGVKFASREFDWAPQDTVFELISHKPLVSLTSFKKGFFYVQDPGTLLAVQMLGPMPGERVLDFCAAPGGKTTYIAQLMHNVGEIVATDPAPNRLTRLKMNCERLGVKCVSYREPTNGELFDRVLVDVPCSNTGVLRRRVDLRWRIEPQDLPKFQNDQLTILLRAAGFLRPGGTLVYSTCSLEPEENRQVVELAVAKQPRLVLLEDRLLTPFGNHVDGAYAAKLVLTEDLSKSGSSS